MDNNVWSDPSSLSLFSEDGHITYESLEKLVNEQREILYRTQLANRCSYLASRSVPDDQIYLRSLLDEASRMLAAMLDENKMIMETALRLCSQHGHLQSVDPINEADELIFLRSEGTESASPAYREGELLDSAREAMNGVLSLLPLREERVVATIPPRQVRETLLATRKEVSKRIAELNVIIRSDRSV